MSKSMNNLDKEGVLDGLFEAMENDSWIGKDLNNMFDYIFEKCRGTRKYSFHEDDIDKEVIEYEIKVNGHENAADNYPAYREEDSCYFEILKELHFLYTKKKGGIITVIIPREVYNARLACEELDESAGNI